jgi:malonate-semialdehyde dehydrogenase (acetylating) / methylmalonate-semialdehyde dehydrogenase
VSAKTLRNYIGGEWTASAATSTRELINPATGELLGEVPLSGVKEVAQAVAAAKQAFPKWRATPPVQRARYLFKLKTLLDQNLDEIATLVTKENGKTLDESRNSFRRGIENVEHACGIPSLMMGRTLEDVATGIDCEFFRQPMGVFAAITPFNFPAMVPLWFLPYAVGTGNTFILKPSEQVPFSQYRLFELIDKLKLPKGVVNMVNGGRDVVNAILEHKDIVGVSFVGSSAVAEHVYRTGAQHGKRVQALGGAKNHIVVMPDADMDWAVSVVSESIFGCSGQRCLAGSLIVGAGKAYKPLREKLIDNAKKIRVGYGLDEGVTMGPLISARHKERVMGYIESGVSEGATLTLDGRDTKVSKYPSGAFVGPTIFENVEPTMKIGHEEIFGPVAAVIPSDSLEDAIDSVTRNRYANAVSIFTTSGKAARDFRYRVGVSMIGVNIGVAAPMAMFPFGGTKGSFYGDLKAHGQDAIEFYTDKKVVISRWN